MNTKPDKRHRGKPLPKMKQATIDTVILAQAMELRDDLTLVRMRADQLIALLSKEGNGQ